MEQPRIKVVCVDDHPVVREGLAAILSAADDIEVIGLAGSGEEGVSLAVELRPDIILMDLNLPGIGGVEAIEAIRKEFRDARVIVLSTYDGDEDVFRAVQAGAVTYLLKDCIGDDLLRVVREVHKGGHPVRADIAARLVQRVGQPNLTRREIEVLRAMAKGLRNKEIAFDLGISGETVQVHVKSILSKLNVHDRTAAVTTGIKRGFLHLD